MLSLNSYRLYTSFFLVFITSFYSHSLYYSGFFFEVPQDFILFCLILFYVFFKDFLKIYLTESEREKCEPMQAKDQAEGERSRFPAVQGPPPILHIHQNPAMVGEAYSNVSVELQCCFFF